MDKFSPLINDVLFPIDILLCLNNLFFIHKEGMHFFNFILFTTQVKMTKILLNHLIFIFFIILARLLLKLLSFWLNYLHWLIEVCWPDISWMKFLLFDFEYLMLKKLFPSHSILWIYHKDIFEKLFYFRTWFDPKNSYWFINLWNSYSQILFYLIR